MADIRVNDIFEELIEENLKLSECLNVLIRFKSFVDIIADKLKTFLDLKDMEVLQYLHQEIEEVFSKHRKDFCVHKNTNKTKLQIIESLSSVDGLNSDLGNANTHFVALPSLNIFMTPTTPVMSSNERTVSENTLHLPSDQLIDSMEPLNNGIELPIRRRKMKINENNKFVCSFIGCGRRLKSKDTLKLHVRQLHSTKPYKKKRKPKLSSAKSIDSMEPMTNGLELLRKKYVNENNNYVCRFIGCGQRLKSRYTLRCHERLHSTKPKNHKCEFEGCSYSTMERRRLEEHMNGHKAIKPFSCNSCFRQFTSKKSMQLHFDMSHKKADQILHCGLEDCRKQFTTELSLKTHQYLKHLKEKRFVCKEDNCSFRTTISSILKQHSKLAHSEIRPFQCPIEGCPMAFKLECGVKQHMTTHSSERKLKCEFEGCDKIFKTHRGLKLHHQKHSGIYLNCEWPGCEYTTLTNARLRVHQTTHSTDRNYTCNWPQCGKQFKRKTYLENHERIHKNDKKYVCIWPGCQYRCTDSGNFIKHKKVHMK